ncbi:dihydrofolate reductase family protein [candidate division KSB1 bacterium]|nr:dihydrofolate reductase family protein [candidate division KSB1 bacterium]
MDKPLTTLFMLMSLDGKISTGCVDERDVDKDFPKIVGIREGLHQYYEIEQRTDLFSMNSGRVVAKVGINNPQEGVQKTPVSFIIIDNKPHLTERGVVNFLKKSKTLFIVTTNKSHPAYRTSESENLEIIYFEDKIDFTNLFHKLKCDFNIQRMTLQTGGTLNSILLREKLIDKISLVIAPALIGGKDTATVIDGISLQSLHELDKIKALRLVNVVTFEDSYLQLNYDVINETRLIT